jgi:hypothetical protein
VISFNYLNAPVVRISAECNVDQFFPKWNGKKWEYLGNTYRSLRLMKSTARYKAERELSKTLVCEIQKEIDAEIIKKLTESA